MAGVLGANYHNLAVSFDDLALVAHRFYRGSDFHFYFSLMMELVFTAVYNTSFV